MSKPIFPIIIFAVLLAAGPKAAFLVKNGLSWELQPHNDEYRHLAYAENLWKLGTFGREPGVADAWQEPLYPILLAPFVGLVSFRPIAILWLQVAFASFASVFVVLTAFRLGGSLAAILSAVLFATYLPMVSSPSYFLMETLAVFLFVATLWLFDVSVTKETGGAAGGFLFGALNALHALTRFVAFPLIAASGLVLLTSSFGRTRRHAVFFGWALLGFCVAYSPWVIRNYVSLDRLIVLSPKGDRAAGFAQACAEYVRAGHDLGTARELARERLFRGSPSDASPAAGTSRFSVGYVRDSGQRLGIMLGVHPVLGLPFPFAGCHYGSSWASNWANYLWTATMFLGVLMASVQGLLRWDVRLLHTIVLPLALVVLYSLVHAIPRYQVVSYAAWTVPAGIGWAQTMAWGWQKLRGSWPLAQDVRDRSLTN